MNRRKFISTTGAAGLLASASPSASSAASTPHKAMMQLGCQSAPTNDTHLAYLARYGVQTICGYPQTSEGRIYATVDELSQMKDLADKYKINIVCVGPPFLTSIYIDNSKVRAIILA